MQREQETLFANAKKRLYLEAALEHGPPLRGEGKLLSVEDLFCAVDADAKVRAAEFYNAQVDAPEACTFEDALIVYKVMGATDESLKGNVRRMGVKNARTVYKKLAVSLHPDKNAHPQAKDAFQRISCIFLQS